MLQLWIGCLQKWLAWVAFQAELEKREPFNIFFLKSPRSEQLINSKHYALGTKQRDTVHHKSVEKIKMVTPDLAMIQNSRWQR
jgi:DNA repair protein RadC